MISKKFRSNTIKVSLFSLLLASVGCTKLHEQVIDEVLGTKTSNPESVMAAAYGQLGNGTFVDHSNVFAMQEYSTDEALLPQRGSDWGDGGKWRAMHEFTWGSDNGVVSDTWNSLTKGIVNSLTAVNSINSSTSPNKALFLAEARALVDFYTYHTLDLYDQAPYRDPYKDDWNNSPLVVKKTSNTIDSLIKDVESLIPNLADLRTQSTNIGRFTKQAAYAFLADMYLNRAVYKDRYASSFNFSEASLDPNSSDMDRVIYYTTLLVNSGMFSLESNYFHNFDITNSDSKEAIFAVIQIVSELHGSSNSFAYMPVERSQKPSPNNRGTNASCITPEFYSTWDGNHDDPRFQRHYQYTDGTWFMNDGTDVSVPATSTVVGTGQPWFHFNRGLQVGQQYGPILLPSGKFDMTADGRIKVNKLFMEKNTSLPVDFTPALSFDNPTQAIFTQGQINRGVRVFKYEFDPQNGSNSNSNVDIPLYRLGGILCMRAEAKFRKGQVAEALADINLLRTSRKREALYNNAPGKALTALTETSLYNEIGFEMYWEMYRRKQMIRFGKFDLAGTAKPVSDPTKRVYPIPQSVIDVSPAFKQNKGY